MKDKDIGTAQNLHREAEEILAITVASINTARRKQQNIILIFYISYFKLLTSYLK